MKICTSFCFLLTLTLSSSSSFAQEVFKTAKDSSRMKWQLENWLWSHAKYTVEKHHKPILDFNAIDKWQRMGKYLAVNSTGKYFAYTIARGVEYYDDPNETTDSLFVQSVEDSWQVSLQAKPGFFADNSQQYIFHNGHILSFVQLGQKLTKHIHNVSSYRTPNEQKQWMAYQLDDSSTVVLLNLGTGDKVVFQGISSYEFDKSGDWLVCQGKSAEDSQGLYELRLYQLSTGIRKSYFNVSSFLFSLNGKSLLMKTGSMTGKRTVLEFVNFADGISKTVWSSIGCVSNLSNYIIDNSGQQVAFSTSDTSAFKKFGFSQHQIWYFRQGMKDAVVKVNNQTTGIDTRLAIQAALSFTDNSSYIQFFLEPKPSLTQPRTDVVGVEVWNHKDSMLQVTQVRQLNQPEVHTAVINVQSDRLVFFDREREPCRSVVIHGNYAVAKKFGSQTYGDRFWENGYSQDTSWVVDLDNNKWNLLNPGITLEQYWFSPSGNYIVYFNFETGSNYFTYNLHSGIVKNASFNVPNNQLQIDHYDGVFMCTGEKPKKGCGIAAWLRDDEGILVYDNRDIWQLDLQGEKPAYNLTTTYGKSRNILFNLFNSERSTRFGNTVPILNGNQLLILSAFDTNNKDNGFYVKNLGSKQDAKKLYIGKYFMNIIKDFPHDPSTSKRGLKPIRSTLKNCWILRRESYNDAPNYYYTTNFKSFRKLTNLQPQKKYNWLSEELHSFKHVDGRTSQGILYKPQNFDSKKKYPVLIVFYENFSNNLNQFPEPGYNWSALGPGLNPIWFLNNGYLVFTPDMYLSPRRYGPEAYNVIEGAARYLNSLSYVDSGKLGCASHSWSAKLGAYLYTHSMAINAMAISEGFLYGNMINVAFGSIEENESGVGNGVSKLETVEHGFRFGNLWENKDTWLDQTTVINVDKAKSPLLLFCNKGSSQEYQNQTLQLFTAIRRIDKKVWWLKYDKGDHTLSDLDEQKDYTIRYTQYFDHYLKDAPAPRWMTRGVRAAMKGIDMAYDLDPSGTCAPDSKKDCDICRRWNEQYRRTPEMFTKPISEWNLDPDLAKESNRSDASTKTNR